MIARGSAASSHWHPHAGIHIMPTTSCQPHTGRPTVASTFDEAGYTCPHHLTSYPRHATPLSVVPSPRLFPPPLTVPLHTSQAMMDANWAAENLAFGSGGALLQKLNRDTQKCAFKCSEITKADVSAETDSNPKRTNSDGGGFGRTCGQPRLGHDGHTPRASQGSTTNVYKDPITDKGKVSKMGKLSLEKDASGNLTTGECCRALFRPRARQRRPLACHHRGLQLPWPKLPTTSAGTSAVALRCRELTRGVRVRGGSDGGQGFSGEGHSGRGLPGRGAHLRAQIRGDPCARQVLSLERAG